MTHVSKHKLDKKAEEKVMENLRMVLTNINDGYRMDEFLSSLLTETEKLMLAKRLAIVVLAKEGLTDSEIATSLKVTRITVAKIRYFYEARGKGFDVAIKKLEELKLLQDFKNVLMSFGRYAARAAGGRVTPDIFD